MQRGQVAFVYIFLYPSHFNCEWVADYV